MRNDESGCKHLLDLDTARLKTRIELRRRYGYAELCDLIGDYAYTSKEDAKGNLRKKQFDKVWSEYMLIEKPARGVYVVVEIYDERRRAEDGRKGNGGARNGAGRPPKLPDELECLLHSFLLSKTPSKTHADQEPFSVHFSNRELDKYFGIYAFGLFDAHKDFKELVERVKKMPAEEISKATCGSEATRFEYALQLFDRVPLDIYVKIREKRENLVYSKMRNGAGFDLSHGIVAHTQFDENGVSTAEIHDDWLEKWEKFKEGYKKQNGLSNDGEIGADWAEMVRFVTHLMNEDEITGDTEYRKIERVRKVTFIPSKLHKHKESEIEEARRRFRNLAAWEIASFLHPEQEKAAERFLQLFEVGDEDEIEAVRRIDAVAYILNKYLPSDISLADLRETSK